MLQPASVRAGDMTRPWPCMRVGLHGQPALISATTAPPHVVVGHTSHRRPGRRLAPTDATSPQAIGNLIPGA